MLLGGNGQSAGATTGRTLPKAPTSTSGASVLSTRPAFVGPPKPVPHSNTPVVRAAQRYASSPKHYNIAKAKPKAKPAASVGKAIAAAVAKLDSTPLAIKSLHVSAPAGIRLAESRQPLDYLASMEHTPTPKPEPHSDGGFLGAITAPLGAVESAASGIAHGAESAAQITANLGSDVAHLPGDTLKSIGVLAPALAHDVVLGFTHPFAHSKTGDLVYNAVAQDPLVEIATGNAKKGLADLKSHPLQGLLDVAGGYGLVGKAAGTLGRLGDVSKLETLAREAAPGISGTRELKRLSSNPVTAAAQKVLSKAPVPGVVRDLRLKNQVAREYGVNKALTSQHSVDAAKVLKKAEKTLPKAERGVAQYIAAFGGGRDTLDQAVRYLEERRAAHESGQHKLVGSVEQANAKHITNLRTALAKPDLNIPALQKFGETYRGLTDPLEHLKAQLAIREPGEMDRALLNQWALQRLPGQVEHIAQPITNPAYTAELRSAGREARDAAKEVTQAKVDHAARINGITDLQRSLRDAETRYRAAKARVGMDRQRRLVSPAAARRAQAADELSGRLTDLKQSAVEERQTLRAHGTAEIKAAKAQHDLARQKVAYLRSVPTDLRQMRGTVIHDENALPIASGHYAGLKLRPASTEELHGLLDQSGEHPAYVQMINPDRQRALTRGDISRGRIQPRLAETGRATYTGEAAKSGSWAPGTRSLKRSLQRSIQEVGIARQWHNFTDRFGLRDPENAYFKSAYDAERAAEEYTTTHGIPMHPVEVDGSVFTAIPETALKEFDKHLALDYPGAAGRGLLRVNRQFRNTVLAMSPKLPVMHTVENATRAALAHAGPFDAKLASSALKAMDPEAAQRLESLATPGSQAGFLGRLSNEDFGAMTREQQLQVAKVASSVAKGYDQFASTIIAGQRWLEKYAQRAALGQHMRRTLQEMGVSMLDANTAITRYASELGRAYTDPALAEDAAKFMHKTMGQYNNFPAGVRAVVTRVMPFAPWYFNAARLVFLGLPKDHPLLSALLQDVRHLTAPQWDQQHKGLPYELQSAIKTGPASYLDLGKFTPVGLNKQPLAEIGSLALPQFMPAGLALFGGEDPFGQQFKGPNTPYGKRAIEPLTPAALGQAASQFLGGTGGPIGPLARAIGGKGSTLYNTSTIWNPQRKPGTAYHGRGLGAGFARVFNPFQGTHYGKTKSKKGSGASYLRKSSTPEASYLKNSSGAPEASYLK